MGAVVLSIDAELAWGFHDQPRMPEGRLQSARESWTTLLDLLDNYEVSATWAIVGHLMLRECNGKHRSHPSPRNWFARDPGGEATSDSLWFAPDLVNQVQNAAVDHELGSHSFSHVPFGRSDVSTPMLNAELERHRSIAEEWNESLESFVFPRNDVANIDLLAAHDFTCYRGRSPNQWYDGSPLQRPGKAVDLVTGGSGPPIVTPSVEEHGIINIPASLDLFGFEGIARRVVESVTGDPIVEAARRGITAAEEGSGVFHGWLHPNNITEQADIDRLKTILAIVSDADVPVLTMGEVAEQHRLITHA